ncbi:PREDICTED: uncharacterized protein LOC105359795 isoform X2 [Ceratosolen solmsi marchali]|uniref:Uncharacterized protein LOC105359795 isoform X1 n=1 Tax=Ceratosolen solmsi marchali TaxID=326594 RepID=A0AAJ6YBX0_9HYME|nr:PREDICTED: uncharacterized protein LOC105359795 isoform X1 [Ceratosolen solmsi marchali]XP_011494790.1 PREDICTED: uncharacterized protein LOC105359795 isoform X2 [Ceratosolen solmsi marchali]
MECSDALERGRNFRLLAADELPQLLDFLATYLPVSLKFHQTLLTYMRKNVWEFHFYVANNWPEVPVSLHFPGMTLSSHGLLYESVGVFCPNDRLECLQLLLDEDALISWDKPLYINFVHSEIADELTRLYEGHGTVERVLGDVWACDEPEKTELRDDEVTDDVDVKVLPLRAEHAEGIHELYPANDMECHELFLRLIKNLSAAGVFANGSLAAWMVQSYYGAMFSMQTKPEFRRKGYGTKLARFLTKRVAENGYKPFVVIRPENEASQSLYKKLGFRKLYTIVRMTFVPEVWQEPVDNVANSILRDNLVNAVRQLNIQQNVLEALQIDSVKKDETDVRDEEIDGVYTRVEEALEPIDERPEENIRYNDEKESIVNDEQTIIIEDNNKDCS